jgi:hypothetical protein
MGGMGRKRLRDMVVLLPGITGSVLQKDGKDLWAISGRAAWEWVTQIEGSLDALHLGSADPSGITATRVMPDAHIVPGLIKVDGYSSTSRMCSMTTLT